MQTALSEVFAGRFAGALTKRKASASAGEHLRLLREREMGRRVGAFLKRGLVQVTRKLKRIDRATEADVVDTEFWTDEQDRLSSSLRDMLRGPVSDGLRTGRSLLAGLGVKAPAGFPEQLDGWIDERADQSSRQIVATSRKNVGNAISQWRDEEGNLSSLLRDGMIGDRGDLVAVTEVSAAFNESLMTLYRDAGIETKQWLTQDDEKACPICEPLDGVDKDIDDLFVSKGIEVMNPPGHPRCRCLVVPVL